MPYVLVFLLFLGWRWALTHSIANLSSRSTKNPDDPSCRGVSWRHFVITSYTRLILCGNLVHTSRLHPRGNLVHTFSPRGMILVHTMLFTSRGSLCAHRDLFRPRGNLVLTFTSRGNLVHTVTLYPRLVATSCTPWSYIHVSWQPRAHRDLIKASSAINIPRGILVHTVLLAHSILFPVVPRTHGRGILVHTVYMASCTFATSATIPLVDRAYWQHVLFVSYVSSAKVSLMAIIILRPTFLMAQPFGYYFFYGQCSLWRCGCYCTFHFNSSSLFFILLLLILLDLLVIISPLNPNSSSPRCPRHWMRYRTCCCWDYRQFPTQGFILRGVISILIFVWHHMVHAGNLLWCNNLVLTNKWGGTNPRPNFHPSWWTLEVTYSCPLSSDALPSDAILRNTLYLFHRILDAQRMSILEYNTSVMGTTPLQKLNKVTRNSC